MPDATSLSECLAEAAPPSGAPAPACDECLGQGGWDRYDPGSEPAVGSRHLWCLQCRGTGRLLAP